MWTSSSEGSIAQSCAGSWNVAGSNIRRSKSPAASGCDELTANVHTIQHQHPFRCIIDNLETVCWRVTSTWLVGIAVSHWAAELPESYSVVLHLTQAICFCAVCVLVLVRGLNAASVIGCCCCFQLVDRHQLNSLEARSVEDLYLKGNPLCSDYKDMQMYIRYCASVCSFTVYMSAVCHLFGFCCI